MCAYTLLVLLHAILFRVVLLFYVMQWLGWLSYAGEL
jgi:hypothetical protein